MFARKVSVRLKPDSLREFASLVEGNILPWLRTQEGFLDLIVLALPDASEVATISFWDHEANAQAYNSTGYPEAVQILEKLLDGIPYVKTFEVVSSTLHRLAPARQSPPRENMGADDPLHENGPPHLGYRSYETSA
jgi:heme-degrading monooxygenase HmoA